jgi:hypothetical protein
MQTQVGMRPIEYILYMFVSPVLSHHGQAPTGIESYRMYMQHYTSYENVHWNHRKQEVQNLAGDQTEIWPHK